MNVFYFDFSTHPVGEVWTYFQQSTLERFLRIAQERILFLVAPVSPRAKIGKETFFISVPDG